ncbi:hypothetical protein ABIB25_003978 [Nakamurella sp. UYEF19]|uniref:hypothetical protein n=1 Tax=Nakamurella sp. UYEF19 TaxID=1756392 RepID=UPI00339AB784
MLKTVNARSAHRFTRSPERPLRRLIGNQGKAAGLGPRLAQDRVEATEVHRKIELLEQVQFAAQCRCQRWRLRPTDGDGAPAHRGLPAGWGVVGAGR